MSIFVPYVGMMMGRILGIYFALLRGELLLVIDGVIVGFILHFVLLFFLKETFMIIIKKCGPKLQGSSSKGLNELTNSWKLNKVHFGSSYLCVYVSCIITWTTNMTNWSLNESTEVSMAFSNRVLESLWSKGRVWKPLNWIKDKELT